MSNLVQRLIYKAVLFTLLISVSLNLPAQKQSVKSDSLVTINTSFACDTPDQANLDFDIDSHVNIASICELQPLSTNDNVFYNNATIAKIYNLASQRAPPLQLI
ncbi:hypothetical protein J8L70_13890 [Pseudoalteromonas sp. MMG010]|uniref:hypothetical protein n=1 Tax=Pseudoalteromonas sp. MMG010 TaxID=2822685 RepID=UPI001B3A0FD2|nr:hypothetical protein [Pseudoalteromonas sp. MMG010]MBQ4834340.1 hypothetical protein [Pseudoalteromonas sp. MMG010]